MEELFESGRIIDIILALIVLEVIAIYAYNRIKRRPPALSDVALNILSGACLMLALRAAFTGSAWQWAALWLSAALAAHLTDLWRRLRRPM